MAVALRSVSPHRAAREAGFSFVELMLTLAVLVIGLMSHAALTVTAQSQNRFNHERHLALEGARAELEILRDYDFKRCFVAFDEATSNDPPDAPGPHFDIPGLQPSPNDPDGHVGRILFPVSTPASAPPAPSTSFLLGGGTLLGGSSTSSDGMEGSTTLGSLEPVLREDISDPRFGVPTDLDGDGLIDSGAKDSSYVRLPVRVEICWWGGHGEESLHLTTCLIGEN